MTTTEREKKKLINSSKTVKESTPQLQLQETLLGKK